MFQKILTDLKLFQTFQTTLDHLRTFQSIQNVLEESRIQGFKNLPSDIPADTTADALGVIIQLAPSRLLFFVNQINWLSCTLCIPVGNQFNYSIQGCDYFSSLQTNICLYFPFLCTRAQKTRQTCKPGLQEGLKAKVGRLEQKLTSILSPIRKFTLLSDFQ